MPSPGSNLRATACGKAGWRRCDGPLAFWNCFCVCVPSISHSLIFRFLFFVDRLSDFQDRTMLLQELGNEREVALDDGRNAHLGSHLDIQCSLGVASRHSTFDIHLSCRTFSACSAKRCRLFSRRRRSSNRFTAKLTLVCSRPPARSPNSLSLSPQRFRPSHNTKSRPLSP